MYIIVLHVCSQEVTCITSEDRIMRDFEEKLDIDLLEIRL